MAYSWSTLVSNSASSGKVARIFWDLAVDMSNSLYNASSGSNTCSGRIACSNHSYNGSQKSTVDSNCSNHTDRGDRSNDVDHGNNSQDGSVNGSDYANKGNNCCVPKGTLITINFNLDQKKVEELEPNDMILSYDLKEKVLKLKKVKEIHQPIRDHYVKIYTKNNQILITTKDHALYTDQGWAAYSPEDAILHFTEEKDCKRLIVGSKILSHDLLYDEIIKIEYFDSEISLYNLVIEDTHCYFAEKLLLHNKQCEG